MSNNKHEKSLDIATFVRIHKWYLLALAGIALTIIIAQILIQTHLNSQLNDSRVINVAGRQRAFSQKLVKEVLLLKESTKTTTKEKIITEITKTLMLWKASHEGLQFGNGPMNLPVEKDEEILSLFEDIDKHHKAMVNSIEIILADENISLENFNKQRAVLLENERTFLLMMDNIVNKYDARSNNQLQNLKRKEYWLLAFSLLILLLEILFIFRPLSLQIRKTIADLIRAQTESDTNAQRIETLLADQGKALKELQELNFVIDNAALFASARKDGSVVFISKKFMQLLSIEEEHLNKPLSELLTTDEGQKQYLKEIFKSNRKNNIRNEEIELNTTDGRHVWFDISIIPMHQASRQQNILILCSDITQRKQNAVKLEQLTQDNFEERILQKKTPS